MDCIPTQAGPAIRAYCGGRQKASDGTWSSKTPLTDNTQGALQLTDMRARVVWPPMREHECLVWQMERPELDVVC